MIGARLPRRCVRPAAWRATSEQDDAGRWCILATDDSLMRIYGYTRVSTGRQVDSGLGLSAQRTLILAHARTIGPQRPRIVVERGVSARGVAFARRRGGGQLDHALRAGDHLIIAKLDRGFRSVRDCATMLERWHARGVVVHLLDIGASTHTPAGRLIISIMAAVAEWESRRIGERIRDAHAALRTRGLHPGLPPLGFHVRARRLIPDRRLQRVIGVIMRMRASRRHPPVPFWAIAEWLTRRRYYGSPWTSKRCWRATRAPLAAQWARRVRMPRDWTPPVGYRHRDGEPKRRARLKVHAARRRYIAHLGGSPPRRVS